MKGSIMPGLTMLCVLLALVLVEGVLVPNEHPHFPWHHVPGYAAVIGLGACLLVVHLSKAIGKALLQRPDSDGQ